MNPFKTLLLVTLTLGFTACSDENNNIASGNNVVITNPTQLPPNNTQTPTPNSSDTTPPTLTLNAEVNITLKQGEVYEELGAKAVDDRDGEVKVSISGSVDTSVEGLYTLTYTAVDSAGNKATAIRTVIVSNDALPLLKRLTLSTSQSRIVRHKDSGFDKYFPVGVQVKVEAEYTDGQIKEVTDKVEFETIQGNILHNTAGYLELNGGTLVVKASLDGIHSNEVSIVVEDDTLPVQHTLNYRPTEDKISLSLELLNKPTHDVKLTLHLNPKDNVAIIGNVNAQQMQNYTITFSPQNNEGYVNIKLLDPTKQAPITVTIDPLESNDPNYSNKNIEPIIINTEEELEITPPTITQTRGAIRGVRIRFEITQGDKTNQTISLVNPPQGMKILKEIQSEGIPPFGIVVQWDVPMDAIEGQEYNITAKAIHTKGKEKTITFPVKVPKTTPIQTEIINNELIVTQKDSPLFGMKMKGHKGEDISDMKLRSVGYEDVWKKYAKPLDATKPIVYTVFVIDHMPEKTDIKFPPYMDTFEKRIASGSGFDRYTEYGLNSKFWRTARTDDEIYDYEGTNGVTFYNTFIRKRKHQKNEAERTQVFIFTTNEAL